MPRVGTKLDEIHADVPVWTLQEFKAEVGLIKGLEGDNEFSSAAIKKVLKW